MPDKLVEFPTSDTLALKAALRAARRATAIASSQQFDEDAVQLLLKRAEHELEQVSLAAGLGVPREHGSDAVPKNRKAA